MRCVVKTLCAGGSTQLVHLPGGLKITPWHPIHLSGEWKYPADVEVPVYSECDAVYSFLLDSVHMVEINGIQCVTLGHSFKGKTVAHDYFGTQAVVNDLATMSGWNRGLILFRAGCIVRNDEGLACGFSKEHELMSEAIIKCDGNNDIRIEEGAIAAILGN